MHITSNLGSIAVETISIKSIIEVVVRHFCSKMCISSYLIRISIVIIPKIVRVYKVHSRTIISSFIHIEGFYASASSRLSESIIPWSSTISCYGLISSVFSISYTLHICDMKQVFCCPQFIGRRIYIKAFS